MKKLLLIMSCILSINFIKPSSIDKKPKIIVLTSNGGNGHMAACEVLMKDALPNYEIKLVRPIEEFFESVVNADDFYGALLRNGWVRTINILARHLGTTLINMRYKSLQKSFLKLFEEEKPDLLISVIPFVNYPALLAAKQYNIPFILTTLDADLELWLSNMKKCKHYNNYLKDNFCLTLQAKTPRIQKQLKSNNIPDSCTHEIGSPLRKDFFTKKNPDLIRKEWNIPKDKQIIMLMRGSTGSNKIADYIKALIKIDKPIHILACIGRNTQLTKALNKIKTNKNVTFSIIPFTPKIPDLMSISDLLITQPSPNVCNEAMHMKLPILIDLTTQCTFWEKATMDWINQKDCGKTFKRMSMLNKQVEELLKKNKTCYFNTTKPEVTFNTEMEKIVRNLLAKNNPKFS